VEKVAKMANETVQGLKVAILVTDGFEEVELTEPRKALDQAGADTRVVSPRATRYGVGTSRTGAKRFQSI